MYEATEKTITLRGRSRIGEAEAAAFTAVINSNSPINMDISSYVTDIDVYKENIKRAERMKMSSGLLSRGSRMKCWKMKNNRKGNGDERAIIRDLYNYSPDFSGLYCMAFEKAK